jgi:hypothetical protein
LRFTHFRLEEAYLYASEALQKDRTHMLAVTLLSHTLYTLHPKKRRMDKAQELIGKARNCFVNMDRVKATELISQVTKWHRTAEILLDWASNNRVE